MNQHEYPGIKGRTAIVTGGAKGIGAACARLLAEQGAKVAIFDVAPEEEVHDTILAKRAGECRYYRLDVSKSDDVESAVGQVVDDLGPPTLLVNNAGIGFYGTVVETNDEQWDRVLNVNLKSYYLCARATVPHMVTAGRGAIVNVASVQSFVSQQRVAAYCASKAGVIGLSRAMAVDHAPRIRSNAICPGTVDTPMLSAAISSADDQDAILQECRDMHPLQRIGQPAEIAHLVLYLLSDLAAFITGEAVRIDGGLGRQIGGSVRK